MSSQQDSPGDREVYRTTGSVILWWVWAVAAAPILIDLAVQGRDRTSVIAALVVVAITGVVYGCALRPRIIADPRGITMANPLRDYLVPWGSVDKVDVYTAVRVHCSPAPGASSGKVLYSWAMQSSQRSAAKSEYRSRRAAQRTPTQSQPPGYARLPEQARAALARTPAEYTAHRLGERADRVRRTGAPGGAPQARWAWWPIAAMVVPIAAVIVTVLI